MLESQSYIEMNSSKTLEFHKPLKIIYLQYFLISLDQGKAAKHRFAFENKGCTFWLRHFVLNFEATVNDRSFTSECQRSVGLVSALVG